jgi:hypothetical protein
MGNLRSGVEKLVLVRPVWVHREDVRVIDRRIVPSENDLTIGAPNGADIGA